MEFFATSNGIPIHISDSRTGYDNTIILLHGYLETLYVFEDFMKLLEPFMRVIAIDLPGHGLSGSNQEVNSIDFAADVVADVLDICKVGKALVAGHSMGGYVAQWCVIRHGDKFNGLILLNSTPFADTPEKAEERMREIDVINSGKLLALASLSLPKMYAQANLRKFDEKIQETLEICETHDPAGIAACLRGMVQRKDNSEELKDFANTLLVFGTEDKYISTEKAEQVSKIWPKAEVVTLENCGHNSFIEQPEATAEAVIGYQRKLSNGQRPA